MPETEHPVPGPPAAEDDPYEDLRPRLDANGAYLDNVFILDGVTTREDGVATARRS